MTRWKYLNRPKFSGFRPGRTLAPATGFVRPLSGEMLYTCSRPLPAAEPQIALNGRSSVLGIRTRDPLPPFVIQMIQRRVSKWSSRTERAAQGQQQVFAVIGVQSEWP